MFGGHELDELYFSMNPFDAKKTLLNLWSMFMNVLFIQQGLALMLFIATLFSPLFLLAPFVAIFCLPLFLYSMIGPTIIQSKKKNHYSSEKWFLINGTMGSNWWVAQNGRRVEEIFGRPVNLIRNKSFGFLLDLLGLAFGRTYNTNTASVQLTTKTLKEALTHHHLQKVVLLAHSTGAAVSSLAIQKLLKDPEITDQQIRKLEVYTFGCAADDFIKDISNSRGIAHLEHFINTHDFMAQIGVLEYKYFNSANYAGTVFYSYNKGHFFNQHYSHLLEKRQYKNVINRDSKLYSYLKGGKKEKVKQIPISG